jgi:hypothetical protein
MLMGSGTAANKTGNENDAPPRGSLLTQGTLPDTSLIR